MPPRPLPACLLDHPLAAQLELPSGFDARCDAQLELVAAQLLRRFRVQNDASAFELLVALTRSRLLQLARGLSRGPPAEPEDLLARFLARLFTEARPDQPDVPHFLGLAVTTMRYDLLNLRRQAWRSQRRGQRWQQSLPTGSPDPADVVCRRERARHMLRVAPTLLSVVLLCFRGLPERDRAVLIQRELEGLSYDQLAEAMGVPRAQVGMVLQRARRKLAARMQEALARATPSSRTPTPTAAPLVATRTETSR